MQQIMHIFRKDCRHFWPEALTCVLVTVVFACIYPAQWAPQLEGIGFFLRGIALPPASIQTAATTVATLLPLSWFVLITRVIQDECLVGERPYWYTRPIHWPSLLAAKTLFLTVFLALPFTLAQVAILVEAGFHPVREIPRLTIFIVASLAAFALPCVCVATVTRNFFRAILTTLGLLIVLVAVAFFITEGPFSTHITSPYSDEISFPLLLTVIIGCIVSQYATRRTWLARTMIAALIPTLLLLGLNPVETTLMEHRYYPLIPDAIPVTISLATEPASDGTLPELSAGPSEDKKSLSLTVPLEISGVPYGYAILPDNIRIRIIAADGSSWTSPWRVLYNHAYRPDTRTGKVSFDVNRVFFERVRSRPVALELSFALTQVEAGDSTRTAIAFDDRKFAMPGIGICNIPAKVDKKTVSLKCLHAFGDPQRTLVTVFLSGDPCPPPPAAPLRSFAATASTGSLSPDAFEVFLSAVNDTTLNFGFQQNEDTETSYGGYLCPGSSITLTQYHVVRRALSVHNDQPATTPSARLGLRPSSTVTRKTVVKQKTPHSAGSSSYRNANLLRKNSAARNILLIRVNPIIRPLGALHSGFIQPALLGLTACRFNGLV